MGVMQFNENATTYKRNKVDMLTGCHNMFFQPKAARRPIALGQATDQRPSELPRSKESIERHGDMSFAVFPDSSLYRNDGFLEFFGSTARDAPEFLHELFLCLAMIGMDEDTLDRTDDLALMFGIMPDAFGTQFRVDLEDFRPLGDGAVRALRFAHVAVDTFVGNHQGHDLVS
jgi:hypothetical protein